MINIIILVGIPVAGAVIAAFGASRKTALVCSGLTLGGLVLISQGEVPAEATLNLWMNPVSVHIFVDGVSLLFAVLVSFIFFMAILFSSYMKSKSYYALLLLNLGSLLLLAFSKDLLVFYCALEVSALVAYFLVVHKKTVESVKAGFKYIVMNVGGALLILLAILLKGSSPAGGYLLVTGCLIKAGSFPVHIWLADAHPAAPSPVSALLSGAMVKVGVYGLYRFAPIFEIDLSFLVPVALISMVAGVILALVQTDVKRILAYHTVSQVGFIILGIGLQNVQGVSGAVLHMVNHGLFKALLFLCMGCVIHATGERTLGNLGGLAWKMPVTAAACLVGCLSISGIPPFNGYVSKCVLFHALESSIMRAAFMVACAGTVASFIKLFRHTFLGELKSTPKKVSNTMKVPLLVLSAACIFSGLYPGGVLALAGFPGCLYVWTLSNMGEVLFSAGLGVMVYGIVLKTQLVTRTPQSRITVDKFFCGYGKAVEYISNLVDRLMRQDINYYAMCIILFLILIFFLCTP